MATECLYVLMDFLPCQVGMPEVAHLSILSSTSVISSAIKCYFSSFSAEDYGYKEVYDGGDYIEMEKGQKLTRKQLQMLEAIAEEKGNSTNPLCKEDQQAFRCLKEERAPG